MPKPKYFFPAGAIAFLPAGLAAPPLGAAFMGLFLIFSALEEESALFVRQQAARRAAQPSTDRPDALGGTGAEVVQRSACSKANHEAGPQPTQEPGRDAGAPAI